MSVRKIAYSFLVFFLGCFASYATHLKGGEITVKRISDKTLTYEFTLTTYTENNRANQDQGDVNFCFGDGTAIFKAKRCCGLGFSSFKKSAQLECTFTFANS